MNKKKIVHIIVDLDVGGAELMLQRLIQADTDSIYIHEVISLTNIGVVGILLQKNGISVYELGMKSIQDLPNVFFKLRSLLIKINPEIIQTWMYHADLIGGLAAKSIGIKKIYWGIRHGNLDPTKNKKTTIYVAKICAILSKFIPEKIICCSNLAIKIHQDFGYDKDKFVFIPNGYDLDSIKKTYSKIAKNNADCIRIAMVARFDPQKDHENMIKAISFLKQNKINFEFYFYGKDLNKENNELIKLMEENNLDINSNIHLMDIAHDTSLIYKNIDLNVLSSSGEAFPNVLAEAMAYYIPCVSTNVGDASYIIGETGWVVEPKNSQMLGESILVAYEEYINNPDKWNNRKEKCRERVENYFSIKAIARDWLAVYD